MEKHSLTEILNNPHFNQYAAVLSVAMSAKWRMSHPEIPSVRGTLEYRLAHLSQSLQSASIKQDFLREWTHLFVSLVEADLRLISTTKDFEWLISVLDGDAATASVTFSMMFAVASTRREFVSAEELAEVTGQGASTWRKRAAEGEIIGAYQAGKTWQFPVLSLKAYGIEVPTPLHIEEVTNEEE